MTEFNFINGIFLLALLLVGLAPVIERKFKPNTADIFQILALVLLIIVWMVTKHASGSAYILAHISSALLIWAGLMFVLYLILANFIPFKDEPEPGENCIPKLTFGEADTHRDSHFLSLFTKMVVKFRVRPSNTNLHKSLRARKVRYWVFLVTTTTHVIRHDSNIWCDPKSCNAGVNHRGSSKKGSEVLRVIMLVKSRRRGSYVEVAVKMFAAIGAPKMQITAEATLGTSSSKTASGSLKLDPNTGVTVGSTQTISGGLKVGATVSFPNASHDMDFDFGYFQWQCTPEDVPGTATTDMLTIKLPGEKTEEKKSVIKPKAKPAAKKPTTTKSKVTKPAAKPPTKRKS